ncbi:MAG: hypothetical protein ACI311_01355 [Bacilli bacterium]
MVLLNSINVVACNLLKNTNVLEDNKDTIAIEIPLNDLVSEVTTVINNNYYLQMNNDEFNAFILAILTKVKEKYCCTNKDISLEVI